jgi:RNA polymerase sigma-70 factor (ECF subfamily)
MGTTETDAQDGADMARLAAGHDAALNDLMERHATPVFHFLCRMLGNEDDANDLAQEAFVRVFRARESFRPDARFSTWLFTIAANLARNQIRWRSRHPNVSLDAELDATDQPLSSTLPSGGMSPTEPWRECSNRPVVVGDNGPTVDTIVFTILILTILS